MKALSQIIPGAPNGEVQYNMANGTAFSTNGIYVKYGNTGLVADSGTVNWATGEVVADGHVRIEMGDQIWVGDHIRYNFKTHQMQSEQFRSGKPPVFAQGEDLKGDTSNKVYTAENVFTTSDDFSNPAYHVRASRVRILPGKYVEMWNAVLFVGKVPLFYFPYYKRNLGEHANNLTLTPGFRSAWGPYILGTYTWYLNDNVDGKVHLDYRGERGPGAGLDLNLHEDRWGEFNFKYYYTHDDDPGHSTNGLPPVFGNVSENRQRFQFQYQSTPYTNLNVKALVNYQSDPLVLHDFFEGEYREDPQPITFFEVNKYWDNWSLDALAMPRINDFFDQVERLPDVKLTGFRQQIFNTPIYYESESSVGYYRKAFADTNGVLADANLDYSAMRADTFHQLLAPYTFFNFLNVTPRAGGRLSYYSDAGGPGATTDEESRFVFNTGIDTSFKASQLWAGATNSLLQVDGLRHIIEPGVSYVYVPKPSTPLSDLPQFDSEIPSLLLLPTQFPDYNDIDSIDSQNVIRFSLRNTLQTKRNGQIDNLVDWNLIMDWRLDPKPGQTTFNDLYSVLSFKPRDWIVLDSQLRYNLNSSDLNLAFHQITFTPNNRWSWGIGHWYVREGTWGNGTWDGNNFLTSNFFFRMNENWGFRMVHDLNLEEGRLQDQFYSIYRDFRWWTGALTFRITDNDTGHQDFGVAFTFSLKASPTYHLGGDVVSPYHLVGE